MFPHFHKARNPGAEILRVSGLFLTEGLAALEDPHLGHSDQLHAARAACKKARATLRLLREAAPGLWRRENACWRGAARRLAWLRAPQALLDAIDDLHARDQALWGAVDALRQRVTAPQGKRDASEPARREAFTRALTRSRERLAAATPPAMTRGDLAAAVKHSYRKTRHLRHQLRSRGGKAASSYHDWRKAVKKLGCQCRLLRREGDRCFKRFTAGVDRLGRLLGRDHDLELLARILRNRDGDVLPKLIHHRRAALQREARHCGGQLFADKPGQFIDRCLPKLGRS